VCRCGPEIVEMGAIFRRNAGKSELLRLVGWINRPPRSKTYLTHGEPAAAQGTATGRITGAVSNGEGGRWRGYLDTVEIAVRSTKIGGGNWSAGESPQLAADLRIPKRKRKIFRELRNICRGNTRLYEPSPLAG